MRFCRSWGETKFLKEEIISLEVIIRNMDAQMETKADLLEVAKTNSEEPSIKVTEGDIRLKTYQEAFRSMKADIPKLKEVIGGGTNLKVAQKTKNHRSFSTNWPPGPICSVS